MMKKNLVKIMTILMATAMAATMIACGKTEEAAEAAEVVTEEAASEEAAEEEIVGMGNPIEEVDYEKLVEVAGMEVFLPDNAEDLTYLLINNELGEIRYTTEEGSTKMTLRAQKLDEFTDISGLYYEWNDESEGTLWDYASKEMAARTDEGDIQVVLWYNQWAGVMYSLSAEANDLDGFDVYGAAMNLMQPAETDMDYPSNELEVRTGKTSFESYDEIISLLEGDEAYALVKVKGYDGDVLLVASGVFDNCDGENMAAIDSVAYTKKANGTVTADICLATNGTAYPISIDDAGLVYCFGHHEINEYCYGDNGTDDASMIMMKYISVTEFDDEGYPTKIGGFYRENNSVVNDDIKDYAEDDVDMFNKVFDEFAAAKVVNFTTLDGRVAAPVK